MERSPSCSDAYSRNSVAFWTTPACASDWAATRIEAPRGTTTRTSPVPLPRQPAASASVANNGASPEALRGRGSIIGRDGRIGVHGRQGVHAQRLLEEHRGREGIDVALPAPGAPA